MKYYIFLGWKVSQDVPHAPMLQEDPAVRSDQGLCLGLCPDAPWNPSRTGACYTWGTCLCLLPSLPALMGKAFSVQPEPLLLQFMPGVPCPATHSSEELICLSTSPPSRHWGGCDVPLKWSLLQAGQVPLSQALGQCSQDTLKPWGLWGWTHFRFLVSFLCWRVLN